MTEMQVVRLTAVTVVVSIVGVVVDDGDQTGRVGYVHVDGFRSGTRVNKTSALIKFCAP